MGIVEDTLTFATNFLTQILIIIASVAAAAKYIISENRKGHDRLAKRILGEDLDGREGKGGLLDELRTELRTERKREIEQLRTELVQMITDTHKELINEFRRTSTKISYMSRDFSRMEKSLEKMSSGRYIAARDEAVKEENRNSLYEMDDGDSNGNVDGYFDNFNKNKRGGNN